MYWPKTIGPTTPLVLLGWEAMDPDHPEHDAELLVEAYRTAQPTLNAQAAVVVGDLRAPELEIYAHACDQGQVPLVLQVRSWPGEWLPQWRQWQVSVAEWSDLSRRHPSVVGAQVVELNCFGFSTEERLYMRRLMAACAEQDKFLSWQEANDGTNFWVDVGLDREVYTDLCRYGAWVLPQWEMNIPRSMYLCQASVMGLWLAQAVEHWGVEAQSWYWYASGRTRLNTPDERFDRPYREGALELFPQPMWGQMLLLGASAGASVYSIEPTRGVVWRAGAPNQLAPAWTDVIAPFFQCLSRVAIPTRAEVRRQIRVAYHADFADERASQLSDVDYFRGRATDSWRHGRQLARGAGSGTWWKGSYGIVDERDMIPKTGRYYWLPVLPKYTDPDILRQFEVVVPPNSFAAESEVRQFLDQHYPLGDVRGEGFWADFGDRGFLCHSAENTDVKQAVKITRDHHLVRTLEIQWGPHAYALIQSDDDGWTIDQTGRDDQVSRWQWELAQPATMTISGRGGAVDEATESRFAAGKRYRLAPGVHRWTWTHPVSVRIARADGP